MRMLKILMTCAAGALALSACATQPYDGEGVYDPLEPLNRQVFKFNTAADRAVIGPVSRGYAAITPKPVRTGVGNVLNNLQSPVIFVNNVLQGDADAAAKTTGRFLFNSTVGILGIFDPATAAGVPRESEDFGQTLAVWGVPNGPYLVLPLRGPTNLRDAIGGGVDNAFDPLNWTEFAGQPDLDDEIAAGRTAITVLNARVALEPQLRQLNSQAEPYTALRRIYTAARDADIRNGEEKADPYTDLPDFDDY